MSTSPQWQFVGNVPENYERHLVPSIFAPWARDLIEAAALQPGARVLDIACGTGIVARTAPRTLGDAGVVGLDLSAAMLAARARRRKPKASPPSGGKAARWSCRWPTPRSMSRSVNRVCSSFPIDRLRCARCTAYWCQVDAWC
jgi:SAM-dependent methyltransferase